MNKLITKIVYVIIVGIAVILFIFYFLIGDYNSNNVSHFNHSEHIFVRNNSDFVSNYVNQMLHSPKNDELVLINYDSFSPNIHGKLHVDSYVVKNKAKFYFDSLLERYAYFKYGDRNFVNTYSGSHGIISHGDLITPLYGFNPDYYHDHVALSTGFGYSNWNLNYQDAIDYANQYRLANISDHTTPFLPDAFYQSGAVYRWHEIDIDKPADFISHYFAFSDDVALSEVVGLHGYYKHGKLIVSKWPKYWQKNTDLWHKSYAKSGFSPVYMVRCVTDVPNKTVFLTGKTENLLHSPHDRTKWFYYQPVDGLTSQSIKDNNIFYSNGNAQLLQYMYRNQNDLKHYHVIDVYQKGYHLSPLMFNIFVREPNRYKSPYSFNYGQETSAEWHTLTPLSQSITNYVEKHPYDLPANYDDRHYYYRTIEGTLLRDDNIKYVNNHVKPLIMGDPAGKRVMPINVSQRAYYNTKFEYNYAKWFRTNPEKASQMLNFKRRDGGFEPLWMIGLIGDSSIGTYHPGEMLRYTDKLTSKPISSYYILINGKKQYLPTYQVNGYTCFKAISTFKGQVRHYVRASDAYRLMGCLIHYE